jgi:hypothetical protein
MPMDEKTKISLLGNEYSLLQQFYEDFDKRILGIKGWSATIAIAAIGGGFYQTRLLWLFAAGASLVFWLLETIWKGFQYCYSPRIELLERAFREDKFEHVAPFQIGKSWYKEFQKNGYQMFSNFKLPIVWFPHGVTMILGLLLYLFEAFHLITIGRK